MHPWITHIPPPPSSCTTNCPQVLHFNAPSLRDNFLFVAMVMADVTVLTDMWKEEEKRIKELLEKLGQQMKDHGVGHQIRKTQSNKMKVTGKV